MVLLLLGYVEKRIWGIQPTQIHKKQLSEIYLLLTAFILLFVLACGICISYTN